VRLVLQLVISADTSACQPNNIVEQTIPLLNKKGMNQK
jgi:hypothetical protein